MPDATGPAGSTAHAVAEPAFASEVSRLAETLGVTLRRARPTDAEAFAAMMNDPSVYAQTMQLPYTDAAYWREQLARPGGPDLHDLSLVVEAEGRVVASAGLHGTPRIRRRHAMMLGITVSRAWQGRGLGNLLMTALCEAADGWFGALRLELTVFVDNERAIALYRRHGFEVEGRHRGYALREGRYVDVLAMARWTASPPGLATP